MARPFFGAREGWPPLPGNALRDTIVIAIRSLDQVEVPRPDPVNVFVARRDGERAALAHLDAPHMCSPCLEFGRDDGPHAVARLEAVYLLLPHLVPPRKPMLRPIGPAMLAPPGGGDHERFERARPDACHISDTQGIEGMGLLDCEPRPVPPGPPACPGADGHSEEREPDAERENQAAHSQPHSV
jgi:hypothetical protein